MGVAKDTLNLSVTNPTFPLARETNFILQMGVRKGSLPRSLDPGPLPQHDRLPIFDGITNAQGTQLLPNGGSDPGVTEPSSLGSSEGGQGVSHIPIGFRDADH